MKYKCPECGWIGTEDEMEADTMCAADDETWSNWICPKCKMWQDLNDYLEVEVTK